MVFHDGKVQRIACRYLSVSHNNFLRSSCRGCINRQHLVGNSEQSVECRLNCFPTIYRDIAVQDFLEHFSVGNKTMTVANQFLEQPLCVGFVRMWCADQIHGDVRIDQNHVCVRLPYPLSISANMSSISPEG